MTAETSAGRSRLNAFQRLMYQWSQLHPYNAVHVHKLSGPLRLKSLREAIVQTYRQYGLGLVHISDDGTWYSHELATTPEVQVLLPGDNPQQTLGTYVSGELNRPFSRPRCQPVRYFVMEAGPESHYLGTTYDHWTADSISLRMVLGRVLDHYFGQSSPENETPLQLYPQSYRYLFPDRLRIARLAPAVLRCFRRWLVERSAAQVPYASTAQPAVDFHGHRAASGTVARLRGFAASQGASVNDVFLAALARATAACLPHRTLQNSGALAMGCIVNTRGAAQQDLAHSLGMFLAYYTVRLGVEKTHSLAEATQQIAAVTREIKARRSYLDSLVSMKFVSTLWPYMSEKIRPHFMRKGVRLSAGISNVLLRDLPIAREGAGCILECFRAAPTGPMLPLVLAPTTLGEELSVGVTYRTTGYSARKVDDLMGSFLEQIENPEGLTRGRRDRGSAAVARAAADAVCSPQAVSG